MSILIIIPARGGSKGIPRKNLRYLGGKPLLSYTITTALNSAFLPDVYVSSDDDEILACAVSFGAKVHKRPSALADDKATLDPVIFEAYTSVSAQTGKKYDLIVTLQPTSPLLKTVSLDKALRKMLDDPSIDTVISAMNDTHLTWKLVNDKFIPNYEKRVNRQYLPPVFRETGGFLITRGNVISASGRIGKNVTLFELKGEERIDIDGYEDWSLCEFYMNRRKVGIFVTASSDVSPSSFLHYLDSVLLHEIEIYIHPRHSLLIERVENSNFNVNAFGEKELQESAVISGLDIIIVFSQGAHTVPGFRLLAPEKKGISIFANETRQGGPGADHTGLDLLKSGM